MAAVPGLSLSPSSIGTWNWCRQAWRYRYEQRLRRKSEAARFAVGSIQHQALEALGGGASPEEAEAAARAWVARKEWRPQPPQEPEIREALEGALETWGLVGRLWPGARIEGVEEDAYAPLSALGDSACNCWIDDMSGQILHRPGCEAADDRFGGRVDLVFVDAFGRRHVVDYKRQARLKDAVPVESLGPEALAEARSAPRNLQAWIYALALAEAGRPVDECWLLFRSPAGAKILRSTPTPEALEWARAALLGTARAMRAPGGPEDRAFPAAGSCYSFGEPCAYSALCTAEVHGDEATVMAERLTWARLSR